MRISDLGKGRHLGLMAMESSSVRLEGISPSRTKPTNSGLSACIATPAPFLISYIPFSCCTYLIADRIYLDRPSFLNLLRAFKIYMGNEGSHHKCR